MRWLICAFLICAVALGSTRSVWHYFVPRDFFTVEPGLYRGGLQSEHQFNRLTEQHHFKTVVSLMGDLADERTAIEGRGGQYLSFRWSGGGMGSFTEYQQVGRLLHDPALRPVFYHCAAGEKRTNAATFAYSLEQGLTPEEAFAVIEQYGFSKTEDLKLYHRLQEYVVWRNHQAGRAEQPYGQDWASNPSGPDEDTKCVQ